MQVQIGQTGRGTQRRQIAQQGVLVDHQVTEGLLAQRREEGCRVVGPVETDPGPGAEPGQCAQLGFLPHRDEEVGGGHVRKDLVGVFVCVELDPGSDEL
ncbi:hypothetical protein TN53_37450 [Streptomyces sp. WM6386]|nr:hypothetical protein TN53_37450 [Streptomyces sp. WM6386]